jgi:hypothetical protein
LATQTPAPQCWSEAQFASTEQAQKLLRHCPLGPHCESMTHVPQVPVTRAWPPPHWRFSVQAVQTPSMHARPAGPCESGNALLFTVLQSSNVVHAPQTPAVQAWLAAQLAGDWQAPQALWREKVSTHPSPAGQSAEVVQAHTPPLQVPPAPQDPSVVQAPHTPSTQIWPGLHCACAR